MIFSKFRWYFQNFNDIYLFHDLRLALIEESFVMFVALGLQIVKSNSMPSVKKGHKKGKITNSEVDFYVEH